MPSGGSPKIGVRTSVAIIVAIGVIVGASIGYSYLRSSTPGSVCDAELSSQIGMTAGDICFQPLAVTQNANSTEFQVPVLIMQPGSTATLDILYHVSTGVYVSHSDLKPNLTATDIPLSLSVSLSTTNQSRVGFSVGKFIYSGDGWVLFRYTVSTCRDAAGYYAILPRYYWGMYPALAPGASPGAINSSALSMWGYTKCCVSGGVTVNSTIVGYGGFAVVDKQVPGIDYCPNAACNIVASSHY